MRRFVAVAAVVLIVGVAWAALAQPAPGPAPGPGQGQRQGRMGPPDAGRMMDMMAERLGLTPQEKTITEKALRAKMDATSALRRQSDALGELARNDKATDKELAAALKKFDVAKTAYRQRIAAIDAQLSKAVSLKTRAKLTAAGIIDNGLGMRFGGGFGGRTRQGAQGERPAGRRGSAGNANAPAPAPQ
jgi:Spy/CpxP family protein refolding chaperone